MILFRKTIFGRVIQRGRTMLEMIAVIAIIGLLSITSLVAYQIGMNKYQATLIFEDVNKFSFVILEHADKLPPGDIGKYDFIPYSRFGMSGYNHAEYGYFYIEVDEVPKGVCVEILDKKPKYYTYLYANSTLYEGDSSICLVANTLYFFFKNPVAEKYGISNNENNGDDGCTGECCNCSGKCLHDVSTGKEVCCPGENQIACGGVCFEPCGETLSFNSSNCSCDCKNSSIKVLNEASGRCECPAEKPKYFNAENGGVCCASEEILIQGACCPSVPGCKEYSTTDQCVCVLCNNNKAPNEDGECTCSKDNQQDDCNSGEFCAYEHPIDNGTKGKGFCVRTSAFGGQTKETSIQTGNLLTSHEWVRSTSGMTWWSAEAWCAAKGYEMASRNLLGCPSATGLCNTTGDYPVLQQEGWTYDARHWLEMQNTWNAYAIILKKGYGIAPDQRNARNYAFCWKEIGRSCVEEDENCQSYNDTCECTFCKNGYILGDDGKCRSGQCTPITNCMSYTADCQCFLCAKGYNFDNNGNCVATCHNNSSCTPGLQFCEFGSPFGKGDPGPSDCKNLESSPEIPSVVTVAGKEWIRSAYSMSWWSAVNWCKAKGYSPVTLTAFQNGESTNGCGTGNGACYNTIAKAIRDNGDWAQNDKLFISTSDVDDPTTSTQQVKYFLAGDSKGPGGVGATDKNASARYAFCYK